jgi:hypothetical protein
MASSVVISKSGFGTCGESGTGMRRKYLVPMTAALC